MKNHFFRDQVSMSTIATARDLRTYFLTFMSIYRVVLKNGIGAECKSFVSTQRGSLVFLHFTRGSSRFSYKMTRVPIGKVLEKLPQHAIRGNLSGIVFEGKNVINEGSNLIIIKGDNSPEAWSRLEAIRDAQEEVAAIRESR